MSELNELQKGMQEVEKISAHQGVWYRVSEVLTIMICGMLCSLQKIGDIQEWAEAKPTREFIYKQFGIRKIPCRAQF